MKFPWTLIVVAAFAVTNKQIYANSDPLLSESSYENTALSEEVIKQRLQHLELPFEVKYTPDVKEFIRRYVTLGRLDAEAILGRSAIYFPVFEHYLNRYHLPAAFKYMPMVESGLNIDIHSSAGASGLWQFVPSTARHFKLELNGPVDERLDPYRSSEAAAKMIRFLHNRFDDWLLVLAAYNCGHGRVEQAMKYAHCDNYWEIANYLPKQTQKYIPAFIAAAYLAKYYPEHGMAPDYPSLDMTDTRTFRIYRSMTFSEISKACGVTYSTVRNLNPAFVTGLVPASSKGYFLVLPSWAASGFKIWLDKKRGIDNTSLLEKANIRHYVALPGDRLETLALLFKCSVEDIMRWNGLRHKEIVANQELTYYVPKPEVVTP